MIHPMYNKLHKTYLLRYSIVKNPIAFRTDTTLTGFIIGQLAPTPPALSNVRDAIPVRQRAAVFNQRDDPLDNLYLRAVSNIPRFARQDDSL